MNRELAERKKKQKDAEKRCQERKRKDKEAREKVNRALARRGKSPIPSPDTTPEPESSSSAVGEVDYSMLLDPHTKGAGGQSTDQAERSPAQPDAGSLGRVSPPRRQTGLGAAPGGRSAGAGGSARAPKSGAKKRKLDAASG